MEHVDENAGDQYAAKSAAGTPDAVAILDTIPGAWERAEEARAQAARGEGIPLDEFAE